MIIRLLESRYCSQKPPKLRCRALSRIVRIIPEKSLDSSKGPVRIRRHLPAGLEIQNPHGMGAKSVDAIGSFVGGARTNSTSFASIPAAQCMMARVSARDFVYPSMSSQGIRSSSIRPRCNSSPSARTPRIWTFLEHYQREHAFCLDTGGSGNLCSSPAL